MLFYERSEALEPCAPVPASLVPQPTAEVRAESVAARLAAAAPAAEPEDGTTALASGGITGAAAESAGVVRTSSVEATPVDGLTTATAMLSAGVPAAGEPVLPPSGGGPSAVGKPRPDLNACIYLMQRLGGLAQAQQVSVSPTDTRE